MMSAVPIGARCVVRAVQVSKLENPSFSTVIKVLSALGVKLHSESSQ
jgi:DNA-binding phage protein